MRPLILLAAIVAAMFTGGGAQAAAPCSPFTTFPLSLNFGTGLNTGTGEDLNCFAKKVQAAVNTLPALRGTANGLATLDSTGVLPLAQLPSSISGLPALVAANTSGLAALNAKLGVANGIATLGADGKLLPGQGGSGSTAQAANFGTVAVTSTSPSGQCATTQGAYTGDATATWVPTCNGVWSSNDPRTLAIYPTRGTTSSNGVYPPAAGSGTPTTNGGANLLVQTKADGSLPYQISGAFINLDTVGGSVSAAHPSDAQSPNATGMLISAHSRPGPSGEAPPSMWAANYDVVVSPGVGGAAQNYAIETDFSNFNKDCKPGPDGCLSAWYFYGGINAFPNLAFHYFGNPLTTTFTGTATSSGSTFTVSSGQFSPLITTLSYAGSTYRVTCTTTVCNADFPVGTNSTPGAFSAKSAMAHYGLFFQDGAGGTQVQDADFLMGDSAQTILKAQGTHGVGLDFTADALPNAALLKAGQNVCYNGLSGCMSFSTALNSWLFQTGTSQGSFAARVDTNGAGYFNNLTSTGQLINSVATSGSNGSTQAAATLLTASYTDVIVAAAGPAVRLAGTIGFRQEVFNSSGAGLTVFPASGQQIGAAGANASVSLAAGAHATFICFTSTQCRQAP